jgi:hypothetical protein
MQVRNPVFTADGRIDCEVEHPQFGWIPFTASADDVEQHGRDAYAAALALGPEAYVAPPPPEPEPPMVPQSITFAQLLIGLVAEEWITQAEGTAWLAGTPPAAVSALIAQLPTGEQFPALARALRPSEVLRNDPLVTAMAAFEGKTPEEVDTFFTTYAMV